MKKIVLSVILLAVTMIGCGSDNQTEYKRVYGNQVGSYELKYKLGDGTPIYTLVTPRGPEMVRGSENLQWSLDVYRENGTYGRDYRDLK